MQLDNIKLYKTAHGNWWLPTTIPSDIIFQAMSQGKIFEADIVNLAKKYIRPGTSVLDIGSNFGQMAILFSRYVGEKGKVYAFEADPYLCQILRKNIEENQFHVWGPFVPRWVSTNQDEKGLYVLF